MTAEIGGPADQEARFAGRFTPQRATPPAADERASAAEDRKASFARLVAEAEACRVCPSMDGRRRVLSDANGSITPRALFVAEAPGRRGADRTGIPLTGDQTGINFDRLLAVAGIDRRDVFLSNAVLCNPRTGETNRAPTRAELAACRHHLAALIDLMDPPVVVALGKAALAQINAIQPVPSIGFGEAASWQQRTLVSLIHPSPRAAIHRSYAQQDEDWRRLGALLRGTTRGR